MRKDAIQQEILLTTCSTYIRKEIHNRYIPHSNSPQQLIEHLEEICWNGQLQFLLPEVLEKSKTGKSLFLWHIRKGNSFLHIEMSEFPLSLDKAFSIDSTFFMEAYLFN